MNSLRFAVHESARSPHAEIWFAEPPGFTAIPLGVLLTPQGSPAFDTLDTAVAALLESAPDERVRQLLIAQLAKGKALLASLVEVGTAHCSIGLHRDDHPKSGGTPHPLLSLLTLTWRSTATAPSALTAARAVASEGHPHSRVEYLDRLACGPVTLGEVVRTPLPGTGLPTRPLLQVHAYLPHPDRKRMAVFTLSSAAVERREEYRGLLRRVVELVSFEEPTG
ncbi:hypothetical protein [Streptomyces silaceus]|uniref:hypothetical protein n=1 Tax=Streptomyces silaceus TaxID=545123 RepID=UPI0006EB710F|nr:hypothetical protein [Streptomyces silaceus]